MTILFDARRPVKSHRPFGRGILASAPVFVVDHTTADAAWWAANAPANVGPEPDWDALAAESAALSRLEIGLCC